jgi:hypothetical protein
LNPTSEIRLIVMVSADRAFAGAAAAMEEALKIRQAQKTHSLVNTASPSQNIQRAAS